MLDDLHAGIERQSFDACMEVFVGIFLTDRLPCSGRETRLQSVDLDLLSVQAHELALHGAREDIVGREMEGPVDIEGRETAS